MQILREKGKFYWWKNQACQIRKFRTEVRIRAQPDGTG